MSGPRSVYVLPLTYKRESTPARTEGDPYRLKLSHLLTLVGRQYNTQWM